MLALISFLPIVFPWMYCIVRQQQFRTSSSCCKGNKLTLTLFCCRFLYWCLSTTSYLYYTTTAHSYDWYDYKNAFWTWCHATVTNTFLQNIPRIITHIYSFFLTSYSTLVVVSIRTQITKQQANVKKKSYIPRMKRYFNKYQHNNNTFHVLLQSTILVIRRFIYKHDELF